MKILLIMLLLSGCISTPVQKLNPSVYYQNDICFSYKIDKKSDIPIAPRFRRNIENNSKNKIVFCGVGVLPYKDKYNLQINSDTKLDMFVMTTCHREQTTHSSDKGIFKKDGKVKVLFAPSLEKNRACPLYVGAFSRVGKHAWGVAVMESPAYQLKAKIKCNGYQFEAQGVSICQSRNGLIQQITFPEPVKMADPVDGPAGRKSPCPKLNISSSKRTVEFKMPNRECLYGFIGKKSYKAFQFYTIGYEKLIVR